MEEDIVVVGSMNMDLVVTSKNFPEKGETVLGNDFNTFSGGKGANQSVAVGKLKGEVAFIGCCGNDLYGDKLLNKLNSENVNINNVVQLEDIHTGVASIFVDKTGDNRIVVVPGANGKLTPSIIENKEDIIKNSEIVLLQLEIPLETVKRTIEIAHYYNTKIILDPAPVKNLPREILEKINYITPNEGELRSLLDSENLSKAKKINKLLEWGIQGVILTRGENGVEYYSQKKKINFPGKNVKAVDTTGAGDAFVGALAYGLSKNWNLEESVSFANEIASRTVQFQGAQTSFPNREEIKELL